MLAGRFALLPSFPHAVTIVSFAQEDTDVRSKTPAKFVTLETSQRFNSWPSYRHAPANVFSKEVTFWTAQPPNFAFIEVAVPNVPSMLVREGVSHPSNPVPTKALALLNAWIIVITLLTDHLVRSAFIARALSNVPCILVRDVVVHLDIAEKVKCAALTLPLFTQRPPALSR